VRNSRAGWACPSRSRNTLPALDLYRRTFRPSAVLDEPYAVIGAAALAADEERDAHSQVLTGALGMLRLRTGRPGLIPTPEEAEKEERSFSAVERDFVKSWLGNVTYGTPDAVRDGLDALAKRTGADELMLTANVHTPAARVHSFELLADAYALP
jgi:alkanesulfonate monooxygenase SsuD/methylene tetrahydromethanopterin reductase-like flavin-dependent oxidoreductase (luciferase family)